MSHLDAAFNCEIIQDCYEAFALYCFERYLIACLGGEESTIHFMESQSLFASSVPLLDEAYAYGVVEHPFPLICFLRNWQLGSDFYQAVKIGIVQYTCTNVAVMTDYPSLGTTPDPEEIADDMKFTVSHVVEPVERGIGGKNSQMCTMTLSKDSISSLEGHLLDPHTDSICC
ncbi:unnamed protein product [Fraxinus pennsylvanica]|uniref:Uncharacterized protein n=1 Tax=Fraxinus pennsylvanica TaxID=56036 RepID=A0AAD1Z6W2_9LAMI|nr:unnamed protein product [Fraxinus pennsylvanica]